MSEVGVKVKSRGFVQYIPPARRALNTETQIQNTEKDYIDERRNCKTEKKTSELSNSTPTSEKNIATVNEMSPTDIITPESTSSDGLKATKSTKKICAEIPREYVPPSRRGILAEQRNKNTNNGVSGEGKRASMTELMRSASLDDAIDDNILIPKESSAEERAVVVGITIKKNKKICTELPRAERTEILSRTELPRGAYIPPARRAMLAEEQRLDAEAEASGVKRILKVIPKKCEGYVIPPVTQVFYEDNQEDLKKCAFIVRGLPEELPEISKDRYLKPFTDKGAVARWISPNEAVLVFPSEAIAKTAVTAHKNALLHLISLHTMEETEMDSYSPICTELFNGFKPERDCRVANRMISAALGIALPKRMPLPVRAKSPKKTDAWDD